MGDSLQQQLDRLLSLFLDEQSANRAHRVEMQPRLDALSMGSTGHAESHVLPRYQGQGSRSSGSGLVPRYGKLDFPKFNGSEDPLGWLSRCDHFFRHQLTADDDRIGLASYHLEDNAQLWYLQLLADHPDLTWDSFKQQCNLRFGPPIHSNKFRELAKLTQTGTVSEYQTHFEILVSRAGALIELQKVQLYISGLKEHIAVEVELHHPADLATAMSISRLYERKQAEIESHTPAASTSMPHSTGRIIKRLAHEEFMDRCRLGLCFKLFWIDVHDAEPPDRDQTTEAST